MKQRIKHRFQQFALAGIVVMTSLLTACSSKGKNFIFSTPQEALTACHKELNEVRTLKKADIRKLTEVTREWLELHDSTLTCMMRDSTVKADAEIAAEYFAVTDSFRTEITRLALEEKRTLQDVIRLKVATAENRDRIIESEDFMKAQKFYASMDGESLFPDLGTTLSQYEKLLTDTSPFKKENDLHEFIREEDKCFRSLLAFLKDTPQERLQDITDKTAGLFDNLYRNTTADLGNTVNERVMLYLTMRFNRRIIQNAEECKKDIKAGITLSEQQANNYRWMVIQPFMAIDRYAMAVLTDDQVKALTKLASELPQLLMYIDRTIYPDKKEYDEHVRKDTQKMTDILSEYFLKSYLKTIL